MNKNFFIIAHISKERKKKNSSFAPKITERFLSFNPFNKGKMILVDSADTAERFNSVNDARQALIDLNAFGRGYVIHQAEGEI